MRVVGWKAKRHILLAAAVALAASGSFAARPCLAGGNQRFFHQNQPAAPAASDSVTTAPAEQPPATTGPATVQPGNYAGRFWMFTMTLQVAGETSGKVSGTSTLTDTDTGRIQVDRFDAPVDPSGKFSFQLSTGSAFQLQPCGSNLCGSVDSQIQHASTNLTLARQ